MLRNPEPCKVLLQQISKQQRYFHQRQGALYSKSTSNVGRQGRILSKLFGSRETGSKKRWFPITNAYSPVSAGAFLTSPQFGKTPNSDGKNATRRTTVLNKLFMKHITDLMATGEISEGILGKGLQISRVKTSQDFAFVSVFWLTTGEAIKDAVLEYELQRCAGLLRHELSQLGLMGVVPRIKFVKDKFLTNAAQVETLLKNMDFGEEENNEESEDYTKHATDLMKQNFYYNKETPPPIISSTKPEEILKQTKSENKPFPEMRHDVLGLDHKGIILKIYAKMRKSKQAWEQHQQNLSNSSSSDIKDYPTVTTSHLKAQFNPASDKLKKSAENSAKFEAFLAKRRERKDTPERKKYRERDHRLDLVAPESLENEVILSPGQRQRYEAEDYLEEDVEDKKI